MNNTKKIFATMLISSLALSWPAQAQPDHHQLPLSQRIKAHVSKRVQKYSNFQLMSQTSIALMQGVHFSAERALRTQDLNRAIKTARLFEYAKKLHKGHMMSMQKMVTHLQQHIDEHQSSKKPLEAEALQIVQSELQELSNHVNTHRSFCKQHMKPRNKEVMQALFSFANFEIQKGYSNIDRQLQAAELLNTLKRIKAIKGKHAKH